MTSSWHVGALGVRLSIRVEDAALALTLRSLLTDLEATLTTEGAPNATVTVTGFGPWCLQSPHYGESAVTLSEAVTHACTAVNLNCIELTPGLAMHAAVVCQGPATVAIAAASGTGKTTLTAALLDLDWRYLTDEALCLPWSGDAIPMPYPRPLALSNWSADALGWDTSQSVLGVDECYFPVSANGVNLARSPGPVTDVVVLYRTQARIGLVEISPREMLAALIPRGFNHRQRPGAALRVYSDLVNEARLWRLDLAGPGDSARALDRVFP